MGVGTSCHGPATSHPQGQVGPRASLDGRGKSCTYLDSIPGTSSPYQVTILTTLTQYMALIILNVRFPTTFKNYFLASA